MSKWVFLGSVVALTVAVLYWLFFPTPPPMPQFDLDQWWGPHDLAKKQDTSIRPFKIQFDDEMIKDLRDRLKNHRKWTPALEGVGFEYGFNSGELDTWVDYWAKKYDFKAREAALNKYPQFKTNIQGLDIHFIRVKPENTKKEVVPLLLLHGWPGSVREFYEAIPLLTADSNDRDFVLELIIPSLPGYGFSSAAVRPGLGTTEMAVVFRNLMQRLGHKKFYIQGGNWGGAIGAVMATFFQDEVLGFHSNVGFSTAPQATVLSILASVFPPLIVDRQYQDRMYPLTSKWAFLLEEMGYLHLHATKPDTIGVSLNDSPAALLAYILEKFSTWTNKDFKMLPDGGLSKKFTKDQLIDILMYYWTTNCITTSVRIYTESLNAKTLSYDMDSIPTTVPAWFLQDKHDLTYIPPIIIKMKYKNLINATHLDDGGLFLAFERPEDFSTDVLNAMKAFRELSKKGKTEL